MADDFDNDAAQYAALEREMAQPDPDLPGEMQGEPYEATHQQPEVEAYDAERHGVPEAPAQQTYQQPQQYQQPEIPDEEQDPIGHFQARTSRLENAVVGQMQQGDQKQFMDHVIESERQAREEVSDYDAACEHLESGRVAELQRQFPDTQQVALLAHSHGLRGPAELRNAILNRDRIMVAQHAVQNGISPALAYYKLASERGYTPQIAFTKSQRRQLTNAIENAGTDAEFDRMWDVYAKGSKLAEERQRR